MYIISVRLHVSSPEVLYSILKLVLVLYKNIHGAKIEQFIRDFSQTSTAVYVLIELKYWDLFPGG
jgi:hypothetical protein